MHQLAEVKTSAGDTRGPPCLVSPVHVSEVSAQISPFPSAQVVREKYRRSSADCPFDGVIVSFSATPNSFTGSGFPLLGAVGKIRGPYARAHMGQVSGTAGQILEGLAEFNAYRFYLARASFLGELCETQALAGAIDDALATVEEALQTNPDELIYHPTYCACEVKLNRRDYGSKAHFEVAEQDFREAIELARRMGPNRPSFPRRRASRGCSRCRAVATKRARCSPTSTTGSPRASTPPTSKRPRRCSTNSVASCSRKQICAVQNVARRILI